MRESKWYLRTPDETFGPETEAKLVEWARLGRIQPGQEISDDEIVWRRVEDVPFLDMRFSIDIGDGNPRGPFNGAAAEALLASGRLPPASKIVEVREPFPPETPVVEEPPEPDPVPAAEPEPPSPESEPEPEPEPPAEAEPRVRDVRVEVPVEKVVEKEVVREVRVEVPVEKIVEKEVVREVRVEVPVEKIVEKVVVDETRVKELEGLLDEERRHTDELHQRLDEASRKASEAALAAATREAQLKGEIQDRQAAESALKADLASRDVELAARATSLKEAAEREAKDAERIGFLEGELERLPQAASEVADIQAAMYGIMTGEADEIDRLIEMEKREYEGVRQRYQERADRLLGYRREILKRAGASVDDMTRKALLNRPEDPRTVQLRKELDELRRAYERKASDDEVQLKSLSEQLRISKAEGLRLAAGSRDITQLRQEAEQLRELLQRTEKDLLNERQRNEELMRQQETNQQALLARLASLESPSIGTAQSMETNQSREARQVKLPGWMRLKR